MVVDDVVDQFVRDAPTDEQLPRISIHEARHAITAYVLGRKVDLTHDNQTRRRSWKGSHRTDRVRCTEASNERGAIWTCPRLPAG